MKKEIRKAILENRLAVIKNRNKKGSNGIITKLTRKLNRENY